MCVSGNEKLDFLKKSNDNKLFLYPILIKSLSRIADDANIFFFRSDLVLTPQLFCSSIVRYHTELRQ